MLPFLSEVSSTGAHMCSKQDSFYWLTLHSSTILLVPTQLHLHPWLN